MISVALLRSNTSKRADIRGGLIGFLILTVPLLSPWLCVHGWRCRLHGHHRVSARQFPWGVVRGPRSVPRRVVQVPRKVLAGAEASGGRRRREPAVPVRYYYYCILLCHHVDGSALNGQRLLHLTLHCHHLAPTTPNATLSPPGTYYT